MIFLTKASCFLAIAVAGLWVRVDWISKTSRSWCKYRVVKQRRRIFTQQLGEEKASDNSNNSTKSGKMKQWSISFCSKDYQARFWRRSLDPRSFVWAEKLGARCLDRSKFGKCFSDQDIQAFQLCHSWQRFAGAALRNLHQGHHHQNDHEDWRSWWWGCRASKNAGSNWEVLVESNWQLLYSYKGYLGGGYGVLLRRRWWRPLAPRTFGQTHFHPIIGI